MAGELGRGQATTFMYRDGLGADVNMSPDDEMVIPDLTLTQVWKVALTRRKTTTTALVVRARFKIRIRVSIWTPYLFFCLRSYQNGRPFHYPDSV